MRRLLYVALLLCVPLPALALQRGSESGLVVDAALESCGIGNGSVVCNINASFTGVEGAQYYTASVTRADGTVQDYGRVGEGESGGSAGLWVPYVGAGEYTVTISAWGENERGEPRVLERSRAEAEGGPERSLGDEGRLERGPGKRATESGHRPPAEQGGAAPEGEQTVAPPDCEQPAAAAADDAPVEDTGADASAADEGSAPEDTDAPDQDIEATDPAAGAYECPDRVEGEAVAPAGQPE